MKLSRALSGLSPPNFSLKKKVIFFPKKTCFEKVFYIFSKKFPNFQKTKLFLYFWEGIFRTMAYLEPWYIQNLKHIQKSVKHLRWNVSQKQLPSALFSLTFKIFSLKTFLMLGKQKWSFLALYFSYISGSNFRSSNNKKNLL